MGQNNSLIDQTTKRLDYNPLERPWFVNATKQFEATNKSETLNKDLDHISWSDPYVFFTAKEPGITASIRFRSSDGHEYVLAADILLKDIQSFADNLKVLNQGQFLILTNEEIIRVLTFSFSQYFGDSKTPESLSLNTIEELGVPLINDTADALRKLKTESIVTPIRFESEGGYWWGASTLFSIADEESLRICVIVPETDLLGNVHATRAWIIIISAIVLIIGLIRAVMIANQYSKTIESLVTSTRKISKGDFSVGDPIVTHNHEFLQLAEAHELMRDGLKKLTKLESDIVVAREIQQKTFPEKIPYVPGFELSGWNEPADETGGDTYDIIGYDIDPANGTVAICKDEANNAILILGDATGHGLGPSLSVTQLRAMLRMGVHMKPDIPTLLEHINEQLEDDLPAGRFITAWIGQIDAENRTLNYFSAGQAPLLHYVSDENTVYNLRSDTYPLGISDEMDLSNINKIKMEPNDIFAVISDGIFEAMDSQKNLFGTDRVIELLKKNIATSPDQMIDAIRVEVDAFTQKEPANDDRTIIIIKKT